MAFKGMALLAVSLLLFFLLHSCAYASVVVAKRDASTMVKERFEDFRENCFPRGTTRGCKCTTTSNGQEELITFDTDEKCKKPVELQTAENKKALNEEIKNRFGHFRDNCFPRGSGHGCRCTTTNNGQEEVIIFDTDEKCKKPVEVETVENKKALNDEFKAKYGDLKENCFPRPGHGCRCTEKDANGNEVVKKYESDAECKVAPKRLRRANVMARERHNSDPQSQNVRDPVREKAQQNYAAVIQELKDKFRGLREGCFPRPKGCQCVVGKTSEGRDILDRRYKDEDCKCRPNERSKECLAPGA